MATKNGHNIEFVDIGHRRTVRATHMRTPQQARGLVIDVTPERKRCAVGNECERTRSRRCQRIRPSGQAGIEQLFEHDLIPQPEFTNRNGHDASGLEAPQDLDDLRWHLGNMGTAREKRLHLGLRGALATRHHRARVTHLLALRGILACDERNDGLGHR